MSNINYAETLKKYKKANQQAKARMLIKLGLTEAELYRGMVAKSQPKKVGKVTIHDVDVVDNSASMQGAKHRSARDGVNSNIQSLKQEKLVNYTKTIVDFAIGDRPRTINWKTPIAQMGIYSSEANTNTPLFQAIGETLERLEIEQKEGEKVLVKIFTDGDENASQPPWKNEAYAYNGYKNEKLKSLIKRLETKGFTITFVGTERDVKKMIDAFDLREDNTLIHDNTAESIGQTFKMSMLATKSYAMRASNGEDVTRGFYKQVGKL